MSKESVAVRIAGHNYKILTEGGQEATQKIATYVDQAMDRVRQRTGTVDTLDIAVLTCLNLARELLAVRDEPGGSIGDDRMRTLIERVEAIAETTRETAAEAQPSAGRAESDASLEEGRTLELPSVDAQRERAAGGSGEAGIAEPSQAMPQARAAAGGRERAS